MVGNKNAPPEERINSIEHHLPLFSDDAMVKETGENGTSFEPVPIKEYFKKIALYRSLKKIEIIEALQNEEGEYWEVRLREHHEHVDN